MRLKLVLLVFIYYVSILTTMVLCDSLQISNELKRLNKSDLIQYYVYKKLPNGSIRLSGTSWKFLDVNSEQDAFLESESNQTTDIKYDVYNKSSRNKSSCIMTNADQRVATLETHLQKG